MMLKRLSHFLLDTLRGRLIIGVAAVHAVMMALFIGDLTVRQRAMLMDRQIEAGVALSQALATSAAGWIAADDIAGMQELVVAQRRYPEILFAILADREGRVLAHTDKSGQGLYMLDLPREARQTVLSGTPSLVDVVVPAMIGGRHVGWARVGIGQKGAGEKLADITRDGLLYALAAILIGSVIAWIMGRRITRRLYAVQEIINAVRSGNRLARSPLSGADEAAVMAQEFNSMLDELAERDAELRASEEKYRSLIRKVQTAIVLHDGQGSILDCNPLAQELLGLSADKFLGKSLIDPGWHFLREDGSVLPVAEYPVGLVLSTCQPLRGYVTGISRPDRDNVSWVMVNAEPEYADAGEIVQVIVSFVDISERKRHEKALAERVMLAEQSAEIGSALTMPVDLRKMLNVCAEVLVRHLNVSLVRIWTLNAADNVLELQASAGMYTRIDGSHSRVPVGKFKIGLIALERKPHVTNNVIGDPLVHDQEWAKREEMVAFAGHPLTLEDKLVGVMAMFSRKPITDVTLKALASVSTEIAIGIERKLAEESLRRLTEELEQRVKLRTTELEEKYAELERMNRIFVGRELRMVELKEKIRKLEDGR